MMNKQSETDDIRSLLESWAAATREGRQDDILKNHASDLVIFDVLPPMKYSSAESYRNSWDDWQPDAQGEMTFNLEDLSITSGQDVAFAYSFIRCGGTLPNGQTFEDLVRATFCLKKENGNWKVMHQHVSKPIVNS